ncbi:MAG: enoyl-CoA hydratase/isomerase family protein [Deltaproteobacteria bacterium]|nr:enoyl-CoA hydratase/isomerase family protein [Deltaproteobacteria bacterium]
MQRAIRKAAVIGAGVMGGGIAALLTGAGISTLLLDMVPSDLKDNEREDPDARNRIVKAGLDRAILSKPPLFFHPDDVGRISIGNFEDDFDRLSECDWIVEAVVENLGIKQDILKRVETHRKRGTIVSSNTSGIPLKKISEPLGEEFRQHFMGTHFFNPVRYMKLLEIIPGEDTLPELLTFMADFGERILGKGIVWAKDTPNFVANRIGVQGIVKAMQLMVEDGLSIAEVDAMLGTSMGRPRTAIFKTIDIVGLDVLRHVAENTYELVPDDEARDSFVLPDFAKRMIERNLIGKKAESGFYKTELTADFKKIRKVIDPRTLTYSEYTQPVFPCLSEAAKAKTLPEKIRAIVYGKDRGAQYVWKVLAHGLIYAANRVPEISDSIVNVDNAIKWGFNFEMGPFETWDAIGLEKSVRRMEKEGFNVPEKIMRMLASGNSCFYKTENGQRFYYDFIQATYRECPVRENILSLQVLKDSNRVARSCASASLIDLGDGVFCCEFHTKMNIIDKEIVDFLEEIFEHVSQNGSGLVIGNQAAGVPGTFSAGGDLSYMAMPAKDRKYSEMESFLNTAQQGLQSARYAPIPVVAAPYGMTLGGGCEVCLAVDRIVAHTELYMGLVEIGVGLLPAGGGCLNLWKKFLKSVPQVVTGLDLSKFFTSVFMNIALAKVSTSAADARANGFLGPNDRIVFNRDYLIAEAKKEVLSMVEQGYAPPIEKKIPVMGQAAQGMIKAEIYNMLKGGFISEYDAFLAEKIAYVLSGGDVRDNSEVEEEVILKLERKTFVDLWKQEKTVARVEHFLKTGKPLRN